MGAMGYAWNATQSAFQKITIDNATGGLNVNVVAGGSGGGNLATAAKGTTVAGNPTSRQVDANTQALDVNIAAGGGTGGGPADVGATTAASESDAARQKTTAAIRVLDTGSAAGSQLVALKGDATNGAFVNVKTSALPTGASTAAKQPALGTAGTASADVISIQGVASMTAVKVDGSGVTQPVSGTVTANAGTNLNTSALALDATLTGRTQKAQVTDGTRDGTVKAASTLPVATDTALVVTARDSVAVTMATQTPDVTDRAGRLVGVVSGGANVFHVDDNAASLTVDAPVGTPVFVTATPSTSGGWSVDSRTALTATAVAIKASAGTFGGYMFYNPNATVSYIQVFNVAAASVTLGTTTPTFVIGIPATSAANLEITNGIQMGTAISYAATTTATGSTAPGTALAGFAMFK